MAYTTFDLSDVLGSSIDVVAWTCWVLDTQTQISHRVFKHSFLRTSPLEPFPRQAHHLSIRIIRTRNLTVPRSRGRMTHIDGRTGFKVWLQVGRDKEVRCGVGGEGEPCFGGVRCAGFAGF